MAKPVIQSIWAKNATNRQIFSDDEVSLGIEYKGPIVSSQLNGIAFDLYTYVDNLQRGNNPWNPLKKYAVGDTVNVRVLFNNNQLDMNFVCVTAGASQPLAKQEFATAFTVDSTNQVAVFTIEDDGTHKITEYISTSWYYLLNAGAYEVNRDLLAEVERAKTREAELQKALTEHISFVYPVGSIYTTVNKDFDPNASFAGTSWVKIKSGLFLEATDDPEQVGVEVEAGLPNITGGLGNVVWAGASGAFYISSWNNGGVDGASARNVSYASFSAQNSNHIYGKSTTVQPNSVRCFIWQRIS